MLLKTAGAMLGADALSVAAQPNKPGTGFTQGSSGTSGNVASSQLRKGMMSFILGHEQFTVPQIVDFGAAAEQAVAIR
jgi:hypothetical protein